MKRNKERISYKGDKSRLSGQTFIKRKDGEFHKTECEDETQYSYLENKLNSLWDGTG